MTDTIDNECELVIRAQTGDEDAFMELVTFYKPRITRMASRFGKSLSEVGDLTQEIFLEVWKSLPKYKAAAPFEHWLSKLAINRCRSYLRKEYRRAGREILQEEPALNEAAPESAAATEAREILNTAMKQLKPDDALVLGLKELDGWSLQEIANKTGWSLANVKVRSHRARQRLREVLEQSGEWP
ncbi:MAG: sigma-70 family RNA polymerase sigma factor [Verrucomicrobiota bacterium]